MGHCGGHRAHLAHGGADDGEAGTDRRRFLGLAARGALLGALLDLLPGGGPLSLAWGQEGAPAGGDSAQVHVVGAPRGPEYGNEDHQRAIDAQVERVLAATFDLSRIQPGHTVLLKVAANSPYKYPMVAHPMVVRAVVRVAKARGARVIIVDQPGFEHVFNVGDDRLRARVRELVAGTFTGYARGLDVHRSNGLLQVAEDEGIAFEAGDLESDYEQVEGEFQHWPARRFGLREQRAGFRVHKRALQAARHPDTFHVISITRPAAHVMAGHTGPTKTWYGWIYTADRLWSHIDLRKVQDGDAHDAWDGHQTWWQPHTWFGRKEVARLHECIAEAARWFERNLPIRAHVLGAIDSFVDVGPDWAQVAMRRPNVIAASRTALPLDALHAAMLAEEKALTPREERRRQALENAPAVAGHADTPAWRRQLETPLFYGIEREFHHLHGTHWWEEMVQALERGEAGRSQGGVYALRQLAEGLRLEGERAEAPPPLAIEVLDGPADLVSPTVRHLVAPPGAETPGIIRALPREGR
jgi:uncharacterized protein (DUF362 family)